MTVTFQYALGQRVRWADSTAQVWHIVYRALHETAAERVLYYGITPEDPPGWKGLVRMADEADLSPATACHSKESVCE